MNSDNSRRFISLNWSRSWSVLSFAIVTPSRLRRMVPPQALLLRALLLRALLLRALLLGALLLRALLLQAPLLPVRAALLPARWAASLCTPRAATGTATAPKPTWRPPEPSRP